MGKNTLVTRGGCDSDRGLRHRSSARQRCESTTLWASGMSAGKNILVANSLRA